MQIKLNTIRRIIREHVSDPESAGTGIEPEDRYTPEVIAQYLSDNAATYHQDPTMDATAIAMLLRDDFMNNIGPQVSLSPEYDQMIVNLSQSPGLKPLSDPRLARGRSLGKASRELYTARARRQIVADRRRSATEGKKMKISMKKIKNIISEEMTSEFMNTLSQTDIQAMILEEIERHRRERGEASGTCSLTEQAEAEVLADFQSDADIELEPSGPQDPAPGHDHAIYGHGGTARMARSQLYRIAKFAQSMHDRLDDQDELPEWIQGKVAAMVDDIDEIHGHLDHKMAELDVNFSVEVDED
jgi:hypothetical protein